MRKCLAWLLGFALVACGGGSVRPSDAIGDPNANDGASNGDITSDVTTDLGAPQDVPAAQGGFGAPCAVDADCTSGICTLDPGVPHVCASGCMHDADCPAGTAIYCAVDRAPSGIRTVCEAVPTATSFDGQACTMDAQCVSNLCRNGLCNAVCVSETECTPGEHCISAPTTGGAVHACDVPPAAALVAEDFVLNDGTTPVMVDGASPSTVAVSSDTVSLTFVAQDLDGSNIFAAIPLLTAPDGTNWIDDSTWDGIHDQPVREIFGITEINSALVPSSDTLHLQNGAYSPTFALFNVQGMTHVASARMRATVRVKRAPGGVLPSTGTLALRIYFVGLSGINAASAPSNARLQSAITEMQAIYATVGISLSVAGYSDITGTAATTYSVINSQAELDELLALDTATTGDAISLFLVSSISATAGLEGAIGVAGDIVGPPGIHGTTHSGVVVGWDSTAGFAGLTAETMGHECGHYLGLWHTHEGQAACTTTAMVGMNCSLFGAVDPISDTPTSVAGAAQYMMNWQSDGSNTLVSAGQGIVMRSSALVH